MNWALVSKLPEIFLQTKVGWLKSIMKVGWSRTRTGKMNVLLQIVQNAQVFSYFLRIPLVRTINRHRQGNSTLPTSGSTCPPLRVLERIVLSLDLARANFVDADEQEGFYGLAAQSYRSLERSRSPSLLIDSDTFSSVPHLPSLPPYPSQPEVTSPSRIRSTKGLLGRRGTAVLNKVLPRSLRLKRWSSTPILPKLQISSPPPLPRMASTTANIMLSPTQAPRTPGPVPLNTAFDYDPYSDRLSDDEDEDEGIRPTTRGTMMSREQLPTPPFLPNVGSSLPYIPPLDSPVSLSFPQSPSASMHNLGLSSQTSIFPPLQPQSVRKNSITSVSNQSLTSNTPISSPTFPSPLHRPFDFHSPVATPPITTLSMSSLRSITTPQHSPQMIHRQFSVAVSEDVEDLFQQMELEDNAFAATEQRMATSGWSTETELGELRAKRQVVRREWEERIENARKKRRGSDGVSTHGSTYSTINSEHSATPVITLPAASTVSNDSTTTLHTTVQL